MSSTNFNELDPADDGAFPSIHVFDPSLPVPDEDDSELTDEFPEADAPEPEQINDIEIGVG